MSFVWVLYECCRRIVFTLYHSCMGIIRLYSYEFQVNNFWMFLLMRLVIVLDLLILKYQKLLWLNIIQALGKTYNFTKMTSMLYNMFMVSTSCNNKNSKMKYLLLIALTSRRAPRKFITPEKARFRFCFFANATPAISFLSPLHSRLKWV